MNDKAIGGYFELELSKSNDFFKNYLGLNSGRSCLEYILRGAKYEKVYLSYFTCDVLLEPLQKLKIPYEFYDVDINLNPIFDFSSLKNSEAFLYTNYFGLKDETINNLYSLIPENLLVDNAQALFANPLKDIPTFYSPRKFVGIPDGGFVANASEFSNELDKDRSYQRLSHLVKRIDLSAEAGYSDFQKNDKSLDNQSIKYMSDLTKNLLLNIDFDGVMKQRRNNFNFIHDHLKDQNLLNITVNNDCVPMIYPFITENKNVKAKLSENRIYCASYWPNVLNWCDADKTAYFLAKEIIALPIDQRYTIEDMKKILLYV